jgi:hypothetical protein
VFVVVTLLVALGIAAAQGCQGPSQGLGDDRDVVREQRQEQVHVSPGYEPLKGQLMSERYESTLDRSD